MVNIYFILLTLFVLCFLPACPDKSGAREPQIHEAQEQPVLLQGITKEKAIAIAEEHALRSHQSLDGFKGVACELTIFWRIVFDGGGPEYVIDKETGLIRRVQTIPENWPAQPQEGSETRKPTLSREQAIEIAKRDTVESIPGTDIDRFTVSGCELQKVWRVFVEYKLHFEPGRKDPIIPHSSAPNYVIDKKTGKILFKQRYGSAKH
jgi:hypothetical protein